MQLEQPGSALQRGQPAGLKASCARRALLPIAQVVQKGDPGLEPPGIWRMSVKPSVRQHRLSDRISANTTKEIPNDAICRPPAHN